MQKVTKEILKKIYKERPKDAKKYDFGLLLVIGGSKFYSGSPALSAMAAFRSGVDMVHILTPERSADIIASFSPNLATLPLKGDFLTSKHIPLLISMTEKAQKVALGKVAVVIGGGIGREKETQKAIIGYLSQISLPAVIDADAIYALSQKKEIISGKKFLITPHSYEFFILTQKKVRGISLEKKIELVEKEAQKLKTTILLKGNVDIIADGARKTALNKTGSPFLTVGGTGDTLAGICGSLLARGIDIFEAGCGAAYINGLAGELAAKKFGESLTATDLIEAIPKVLNNKVNG
jgi:NAD(P)H-hydrate epimerase